jgi:hypothetical protein
MRSGCDTRKKSGEFSNDIFIVLRRAHIPHMISYIRVMARDGVFYVFINAPTRLLILIVISRNTTTTTDDDYDDDYVRRKKKQQQQSLNCLRLASRIDAVASRLETAVRMNAVTKSMKGVVRGMDKGLASMDVDKISATMDKFERQFEDLDVKAAYSEFFFFARDLASFDSCDFAFDSFPSL